MDELYEIIIEPCYAVYAREHFTTLMRLHTLWQDYHNNWVSGDVESVTNAWHGIQAMVQIFRERGEWEEDNRKPRDYFQAEKTYFKEIQCTSCKCSCTWDEQAWGAWDGECPACGTILDPNRCSEDMCQRSVGGEA